MSERTALNWADDINSIGPSPVADMLRQQHAEIERLKTVPMKYRRMAFNAQLQEENTQMSEKIERLTALNSALTAKADVLVIANARLDEKIDSLTAERDTAVAALTSKPPPEGSVPHAFMLETTRMACAFWEDSAKKEKRPLDANICLYQSVYGWKNAAYAMAEKAMALGTATTQLTKERDRLYDALESLYVSVTVVSNGSYGPSAKLITETAATLTEIPPPKDKQDGH